MNKNIAMCRNLICRHEPLLSNTTDADEKFPEKKTMYVIDGEEFEGVFSVDLTLDEIKTLRARQPNPKRDRAYDDLYEVSIQHFGSLPWVKVLFQMHTTPNNQLFLRLPCLLERRCQPLRSTWTLHLVLTVQWESIPRQSTLHGTTASESSKAPH